MQGAIILTVIAVAVGFLGLRFVQNHRRQTSPDQAKAGGCGTGCCGCGSKKSEA